MPDQFPPDLPSDEADPTSGEQPDAPKGFGNGPEPEHTENAAEAELRALEAEIRALEAEIEAEEQALDPETRRALFAELAAPEWGERLRIDTREVVAEAMRELIRGRRVGSPPGPRRPPDAGRPG